MDEYDIWVYTSASLFSKFRVVVLQGGLLLIVTSWYHPDAQHNALHDELHFAELEAMHRY